jgi:hypothetical protein
VETSQLKIEILLRQKNIEKIIKQEEMFMANRSKEWSEDIAKKLKKKACRQQFFLSLIQDESLSLREAIQIVAKSMGNQEFSKLIDMAPSNTSRIVNPNNDIKATTLEHVLKKLGCELSVRAA